MNKAISKIKSKAYLIVVGAFIIGVVTGGLIMNLVLNNVSMASRSTPLEELFNELKLDPEQQKLVENINIESRKQYNDLLKDVKPQLIQLRTQTRSKIRAVLTPDQQVRYDNWNQLRDQERKKRVE